MEWAPAPDTQIGGDVVPTATTNTASVPVIIIGDDDSPAKSVAMDTASVGVGSGSRTDVIMIDDADVNEGLRADTDTEPGADQKTTEGPKALPPERVSGDVGLGARAGSERSPSPPPPAKGSRPAQDPASRRKVTFNPQVQESLLEVANEPPKPATLKEVADIVVRCLDPFYKQGKFATKELFKSFARHLSHLLTEGRSHGRGQVKAEAKALIKKFFSGLTRCEREVDWKLLKAPAGADVSDEKGAT
ncbi:hypothetical protein CRUP_032849 [Coryphaenoides rupestris]|nr:hypothetical protein CRUP_032849 [Coryphaenoides rupestris]